MINLSRLMTKPTKWHVRPEKTQISLGICQVWSESSLSVWRKLESLDTHWVHSKDSDQTGRMPRLNWVFAGRTVILMVFFHEVAHLSDKHSAVKLTSSILAFFPLGFIRDLVDRILCPGLLHLGGNSYFSKKMINFILQDFFSKTGFWDSYFESLLSC